MKKSIAFALISVAIWSTLSTATKILISDLSSVLVIAISSAVGALFLLFYDIFKKKLHLFKKYSMRQYLIMIAMGIVGIFLYSALYYYGLGVLSAQAACTINYLWPIMIVLFSVPILKEKLTVKKIIAIVCSFAGVAVLASGEGGGQNKLIGVFACLGAAVTYGLFSVVNKKFAFDQEVLMPVVWGVTAVCSSIWVAFNHQWSALDTFHWLGILYVGVFVNAVAYLTWALSLNQTTNIALISNLAYLTPLLSVGVSAVVLKEQIKLTSVIALVLIIGGVLFQSINQKLHKEDIYE